MVVIGSGKLDRVQLEADGRMSLFDNSKRDTVLTTSSKVLVRLMPDMLVVIKPTAVALDVSPLRSSLKRFNEKTIVSEFKRIFKVSDTEIVRKDKGNGPVWDNACVA